MAIARTPPRISSAEIEEEVARRIERNGDLSWAEYRLFSRALREAEEREAAAQ